MIFNLFGLSIKSGKVKTEEKEVSVTADQELYYYSKKDKNAKPIKPNKLGEVKH